MAIQTGVIIGAPVCPGRVSHSCPSLNRFVCGCDPVSQYVSVRAHRKTHRTITHAALLTINRNRGSAWDTGTRVKTLRHRVSIQQMETSNAARQEPGGAKRRTRRELGLGGVGALPVFALGGCDREA